MDVTDVYYGHPSGGTSGSWSSYAQTPRVLDAEQLGLHGLHKDARDPPLVSLTGTQLCQEMRV